MRRTRAWLVAGIVLAGGIAAVLTAVGWEVVLGPEARPVTDRRFEATSSRLARGDYLVNGPAHCLHCHTPHDFSDPEYPIVRDLAGSGWELPLAELGRVVAPNITSDPETGLGAWTDDEIARAIQEGVSRDGSALFPIMPYSRYVKLDDEDLASVVVHLRTLPPVRKVQPRTTLVFPLNVIVNLIPEPRTGPRPSHPSSTAVERGRYLVGIADCESCHSAVDRRGRLLPGLEFGGGATFADPGQNGVRVASANITPDPSGLAHYDEAFFIQTIRSGRMGGRVLNHAMPFEAFTTMTDRDLADIWAFLQTVPPVRHRVSNTNLPTPCPVCRQSHGLGELNRMER